jgi:DNA-binding NarL/FixJ family response regulator
MPGLDGPQTLKRLRQLAPRLRCCFLSGDTGHYTAHELLALGPEAVLEKPFRLDNIGPFLRWLVQGRR